MKISLPLKFALASFVITLFGVVGMAWMAYQESDQLLQQEAVRNLSMQVSQEASWLESQAALIKSDVAFLAQSESIKLISGQFSKDLPATRYLGQLEILFSTVLVEREMYYQVRLIVLLIAGVSWCAWHA